MIRTPEDAGPEWLTGVLKGSGALREGSVTRVDLDVDQRRLSFNAHLQPGYSDDSTGSTPARLFLKTCDGGAHGFVQSEVDYYLRDRTDLLVRCHGGVWSDALLAAA